MSSTRVSPVAWMSVAETVVIGLIEVELGFIRRDPVTTTSCSGAAFACACACAGGAGGASWPETVETPAAADTAVSANRTACCKLRLFAMCWFLI